MFCLMVGLGKIKKSALLDFQTSESSLTLSLRKLPKISRRLLAQARKRIQVKCQIIKKLSV